MSTRGVSAAAVVILGGGFGTTVSAQSSNPLVSDVVVGTSPASSATVEYEITFRNEWTMANHTNDYPRSAHWSPPVFASHNSSYVMWASGTLASPGVERVAEFGSTGTLRAELNNDNVLNFVVGDAMFGLEATPTQVFGEALVLDPHFPLISGISMIAPSSDWFAGMRDIKPQSDDGFWWDSFTVAGYPYDAGTNSGSTYAPPYEKTVPPDSIARLTPFTVPSSNVFVKDNDVLPVLTISFRRVGAPPPPSPPPPSEAESITQQQPPSNPLEGIFDASVCTTKCGQDQMEIAEEYYLCYRDVQANANADKYVKKDGLKKCKRAIDQSMLVAMVTSCRNIPQLSPQNLAFKTKRNKRLCKDAVRNNYPPSLFFTLLTNSVCPDTKAPTVSPTESPVVSEVQQQVGARAFFRTSALTDPLPATIPLFDPDIMEGYSTCDGLKDDLVESLRFYASSAINQETKSGGFRLRPVLFNSRPESLARDATATTGGEAAPPSENSFETNNQVDDVDEADFFKSNGVLNFVAYGDELVVWDAVTGVELSRTKMPTPEDEIDDDYCVLMEKKMKEAEETKEPEPVDEELDRGQEITLVADLIFPLIPDPCLFRRQQNFATIDSLLLEGDRLTAVVSGYTRTFFPYPIAFRRGTVDVSDLSINERIPPILSDNGSVQLRVYDIGSVPNVTQAMAMETVPSMKLLATKDLQGQYVDGRAIGSIGHVVTMANIDLYTHLREPLLRWKKEYQGLNDTEYRSLATETAERLIPVVADRIVTEFDGKFGDQCERLVQFAMFTKGTETTDDDDATRNFLDSSATMQNIAIVTSFDMNEVFAADSEDKVANLTTLDSGAFTPQRFATNVYASTEVLVLSSNGYFRNSTDWSYTQSTFFLAFRLPSDGLKAAVPFKVGEVEGTIINQFAMDQYQRHFRVATTTRARFGCLRFAEPELVEKPTSKVEVFPPRRRCANWGQLSTTTNQVYVLELFDGDGDDTNDSGEMKEVGRVDNVGKPGESIFSVRFIGPRAYVVTFLRIDPFISLDLSDPENPFIAGELEIPGFSNYLHPIQNDKFILAVGRDADSVGRALGVQVSIFNVTELSMPTLVHRYNVSDEGSSFSDAAFDPKAFRYLDLSERLILPVSVRGAGEFFDGFFIIKASVAEGINFQFQINHREFEAGSVFRCYGRSYLSSRSAVFDSKVTTMKGRNVVSHDLNTEEFRWLLELDKGETKQQCYGWFI